MKEGWICPRCKRINAPFVMYCDCKKDYDNKENDFSCNKTEDIIATAIDASECRKGNHDWQPDSCVSSVGHYYRCSRCGAIKVEPTFYSTDVCL